MLASSVTVTFVRGCTLNRLSASNSSSTNDRFPVSMLVPNLNVLPASNGCRAPSTCTKHSRPCALVTVKPVNADVGAGACPIASTINTITPIHDTIRRDDFTASPPSL